MADDADELRRVFRDLNLLESRVRALRDKRSAHSGTETERRKWRRLHSAVASLNQAAGALYDVLPPFEEGQCACQEVRVEGGHWSYCPAYVRPDRVETVEPPGCDCGWRGAGHLASCSVLL